MTEPLDRLSRRIDYKFNDDSLLEAALTHRSVGNRNNERLEFLGDGVLNCVIGEAVFRAREESPEGDLSRLRASLVRETTLVEIARALLLGDYIRLGSGELKSGGFRRPSILADALEALIGAIYLDGGFDAARKVVLALYAQRLQALPDAAALKDPKTRLQEYLQGRHMTLPEYTVLEVSGEPHRQCFRVECRIDEAGVEACGEASSRRRAEQEAAAQALDELQHAQ